MRMLVKRKFSSTHQARFPWLCGGHSQVIPPRIECINLDAPVRLRLSQPHSQYLFDVYTLPRADTSIHVNLQGPDPYAPIPVCDRHQAGDLQEHRGRFVCWPEVHPELATDYAIGLKLLIEGEKAASWYPIYLHDGFGWRGKMWRGSHRLL